MQSTFVQLVFTPTAEKMYTGNINIKSDAENTMSIGNSTFPSRASALARASRSTT